MVVVVVVVGIFTYDLNLLQIGRRPSSEHDLFNYYRDPTIK